MRHLVLALGTAVVLLAITGFVLASSGGQWDDSSIAADPPVVNLAQQRQVTLTVHLVNAGPDVADPVSVTCAIERGEILAAVDAYTVGNQVQWAGSAPVGTTTITFTVRPTSWPTMTIPCRLYDEDGLSHAFTGTVEIEPLRTWLPFVARDVLTVPLDLETVNIPLLRFYEATAYGDTITEALTLSTVHFWQWPVYRHTASAWVFHPFDWPTGASVQRLTYVFDLARFGGRRVVSASVLFDSASYVTAAGLPNVPAWVSQGEFTRPSDALQAFTGGQRGPEWPWWLELNYGGFSWCQKATLPIPVDDVDWSRSQLALFVRSGVEERPDVWAGDRIYLHRFGWGLEQVCPQPQDPTLIVEVAEE